MITILNIIRILYSHYIVNRNKNIGLDSSIIAHIIETSDTTWLNKSQMCMWSKYLKSIGKCKNWNEYQMLREMIYHKNLYKYGIAPERTVYTDFEEVQTIKTYIRRIIGNCIF